MLTSAKTWCPCNLDALVNTSVFCMDQRLKFGGLVHIELYFNRTKALIRVGKTGLYQRLTEMCMNCGEEVEWKPPFACGNVPPPPPLSKTCGCTVARR